MEENKVENELNEKKGKKNVFNIIATVVQVVLIAVCLIVSLVIITNPGGYRQKAEDCNTGIMVVMSDSMTPTIGTDAIIFGSKKGKNVLELGTVVTFAVNRTDGYILNTHRIVGYQYRYNESSTSIAEGVYYYKKGERDSYSSFKTFLSTLDGGEFVGYRTRGDKYTLYYGATLEDYSIYDQNGFIISAYDDTHSNGYALTHDEVLAVWKGAKIEGVGKVMKWLQKPLHFALCILLPLVLLFIYNIFLVVKMIIADKSEKAKKAALEELKKNDIDEEEIKRKAVEEYLASLKKNENNEEKKAE